FLLLAHDFNLENGNEKDIEITGNPFFHHVLGLWLEGWQGHNVFCMFNIFLVYET
ncbi:hypothetical protein HMI54_012004, partial [Coelomomyces lativittatus]